MPDDILDAAQKAINDAAGVASSPVEDKAPVVPPAEPAPVAPPPEPEPAPMTPPPAVPTEPAKEQPTTPAVEPAIPAPTPAPTPAVPPAPAPAADILSTVSPDSTIVPPVKPNRPSGGAAPSKRRFPIAVMAVFITLLLAIPVAVYYISQQNQQLADVRSRASGNVYGTACGDGTTCPAGTTCHCKGGQACTGYECVDDNWVRNVCTSQGRSYCQNSEHSGDNGWTCCSAGYSCCSNSEGCCQTGPGPTHTPHPPNPPGDTATPTQTVNPVCQNIKIYKGTTQVTDLTTLKAGDNVTFAVKGNLSPTKAHFRVNGGNWSETTTKNGSNEYTQDYTIPSGVTDFVIEGEVFTNGAWH